MAGSPAAGANCRRPSHLARCAGPHDRVRLPVRSGRVHPADQLPPHVSDDCRSSVVRARLRHEQGRRPVLRQGVRPAERRRLQRVARGGNAVAVCGGVRSACGRSGDASRRGHRPRRVGARGHHRTPQRVPGGRRGDRRGDRAAVAGGVRRVGSGRPRRRRLGVPRTGRCVARAGVRRRWRDREPARAYPQDRPRTGRRRHRSRLRCCA